MSTAVERLAAAMGWPEVPVISDEQQAPFDAEQQGVDEEAAAFWSERVRQR